MKSTEKSSGRPINLFALLYVYLSFIGLWFYINVVDKVNKPCLRKTLSILTAFNLFLGLLTVSLGVTKYQRALYQSKTNNAQVNVSTSHYIGLIFSGAITILFSVFGFIGIYNKNLTFTKAFAIGSFFYGYLLTAVYISWLTEIYFIKYKIFRKFITAGKNVTKMAVTPRQKDSFDPVYLMNFILVAAITELISGGLTFWLLVMYLEKKGYLYVYKR